MDGKTSEQAPDPASALTRRSRYWRLLDTAAQPECRSKHPTGLEVVGLWDLSPAPSPVQRAMPRYRSALCRPEAEPPAGEPWQQSQRLLREAHTLEDPRTVELTPILLLGK